MAMDRRDLLKLSLLGAAAAWPFALAPAKAAAEARRAWR